MESVIIKSAESVSGLGEQLVSELTLRTDISKTASSCFFHLLRRLRSFADPTILQQLAKALILSRIDYCNAVLASLPQSTLAPLQRVTNAVVRVLRLDIGGEIMLKDLVITTSGTYGRSQLRSAAERELQREH